MKDLATMGRKSINKAIDKVQATIDAANIPLPESPLNVGRVQSAANDAMAMTITPAQNMSRDLTKVLRPYSNVLVKYSGQHKRRVESGVSMLQQVSDLFLQWLIPAVLLQARTYCHHVHRRRAALPPLPCRPIL